MENNKNEQVKPKRVSIVNAAFLLMGATFIGQILGFLRTKLVNANFPITGPHGTDAYFAAFNVPDFFFFTLSAGVIGVSVMPILADRITSVGIGYMWKLVSSLLNFLSLIMLFVAIVIIIFADQLIRYVVAPNLSPTEVHTAATIMRLLAFNPLLFTVSGLLTAAQQTMGRFFFYA
ncbi:virulence factor MviN, partial [bacterium]|nr:virulence factor MviN [bacterium]